MSLEMNTIRLENVSRRSAIKSLCGMAMGLSHLGTAAQSKPSASLSINPRWYGFNLLEYFSTDPDWMKYFPYVNDGGFKEDDFQWMRDWGFNWVRLPMDYRFWTSPKDPMQINEKCVLPIDRAIRLGERYGIHINICLHRAPGECCLDQLDPTLTGIQVTRERTSVYNDPLALAAFVNQWTYFAKRYKGISSDKLSFNLVNEPRDADTTLSTEEGEREYARVARAAIRGIRNIDPERLIVTDGYPGADAPIAELIDTHILQSCHDYYPIQLTHYRCEWARGAGSDRWPPPGWPLKDAKGGIIANSTSVWEKYRAWGSLAKDGIPIHFGEMGCYKHTPPTVVYAWFDDALDMIGRLRSGWALWNFRGPFGILDTERAGTHYRNWHGHSLDVTLLKLLQNKMKA